MNTLMLVVLAVVALCYCGGKYCPKVLSSNKEMLLGVLVGLALCSFAGLKLEGFWVNDVYHNRDGYGDPREWNAGTDGTRFTIDVDCEPTKVSKEAALASCDRCPTNTMIHTHGSGSVSDNCRSVANMAWQPCPDEPCDVVGGKGCVNVFGHKTCDDIAN